MVRRYDVRPDDDGFTVFDVFTGQPVVIHDVPQSGLRIEDANDLAELLERPSAPPGRIWQ